MLVAEARGYFVVENRYQAMTGKDTADWEDLARAVIVLFYLAI
jgi:hypothetical protein